MFPSPSVGCGAPTLGVVPVESFPNLGLPLPERDPQEVVGSTAELDHLSRGVHE